MHITNMGYTPTRERLPARYSKKMAS